MRLQQASSQYLFAVAPEKETEREREGGLQIFALIWNIWGINPDLCWPLLTFGTKETIPAGLANAFERSIAIAMLATRQWYAALAEISRITEATATLVRTLAVAWKNSKSFHYHVSVIMNGRVCANLDLVIKLWNPAVCLQLLIGCYWQCVVV